MKCNGVLGVMILLVVGFICESAAAQSRPTGKSSIAQPAQKQQLADNYGRLPLSFEINHGQVDPRVKFLSRSAGQTLFLTSNEADLALSKPPDQKPDSLGFPNLSTSHSLRTTLLRMRLLGANPLSDVTGLESLPGKNNYFMGNDPAKWRTNVPTYGKVRYSQIYSGIDLVFYGNQRQLEYDFVVSPGADPAQIRLAIRGASKLSIDAEGNAVVQWKDGAVQLLRPRLYQEVRAEKIEIAGGYAIKGNELRFVVGQYDHRKKLVIDPVLVYSTYLGGPNSDGATGVAVDSAGNAYVVGTTSYTGFPVTSGVFQPTSHGTTNAFVAKLNAAGTALVYSTYLGGSGQDTGYAIAVDTSGGAYVTGATTSSDFPITSGAFQSTTKPVSTPGSTVFVTKLSPDGSSLAYSTYLGGSANDLGFAIAVDASGSAYVTGETQSGNFPVYGSSPKVLGGPISCDSMNSGGFDGFITKVSPAGDTLAYSLYLGGSGTDVATGVAVDSAGNAYVAGYTSSTDFLVKNTCPGPGPGPTSLQPANAGANNGFIVEINPTGTAFLGSTYLGGNGQEAITSIAVDGSDFVYLAGEGNSGGAGGFDAFGAKLNGSLSSKVYFNYIGGSGFDRATGVAVDSAGNEYLVGQTASTNFPQVSPLQPAFGGGTYDAFVTELDSSGTIVFSTYLGGSGDESTSIGGAPIAVDSSGNVYVVGSTTSTNFPEVDSSSIQPANGGGSDAFIAKLGPSGAATVTALVASINPSVFGQQVSFTVNVTPNSSSALTPSGNVTISDGSTTLAAVPLASGSAIFNTSTLAVGSHSITAAYAGDSNFSASTSTPLSQVVNQSTTTTSVSASPNPGFVGQPVTLTATVSPVSPPAGTPTGRVTFFDGATNLGTGILSGGQATLATSSLTSGTHSITVAYAGDLNFLGSASSAVGVTIQQSTTTTLVAAPNPANAGQLVTLAATVAGSSGGPTGEPVTFLDGVTVLGTGTISAGRSATFTTASLAVGNHNLSASYPGDSNFAASTSATVTLSVLLPPAVITDNEMITVSDAASFPDVFDAETVHAADAVFVTPLIQVSAPVAEFSAGSLGFSGQSGSQTITVSDIGLASLTFTSAGISGSSQFAVTQISCTNSATSLSTVLPSGGVCAVTIGYTASATPASDNGVLTLTDNAALSNLPTVASGSNYAQSIPLSGSGGNTTPPPPPPAVIPIPVNETIHVTDTRSFPDVFDPEAVRVTDSVFLTPLISVSAPVAEYSAGSLGFGGQSGSQTITVSDIGLASLTLTSATISGSPQFAVTQISCSNSSTSLSTVLPSGGVCAITIGYTASATPANDNGALIFTDNAALSNLPAVGSSSNYTQSIPLNGSGATTPPPPPPPAVVPVMDNETIFVTDTVSFPDVFDAEAVHVADAVFVTPLIQVSAPVAEFSAGSLGFSGQSGSQTITVSDIGLASLTLTSATISGSSQFAVMQISCTNSSTSLSTVLPSGGVCAITIDYAASVTPANDNGVFTIADNAALSNVASTPAGSSYTQSFALNGSGTTTPPLPSPPAVVPVMDNETITVTDTPSFPDVLDPETIKVTDQVLVQAYPLTTTSVSGPGVTYGTAAVVTVFVSSAIGPVTGSVTLSVDGGTPSAMALTNGSATFNLGVLNAGTHSVLASFAIQGGFSGASASTTLTVIQAAPVITWVNPSAIASGTALSSTQLNATASVPGTFLYTPATGTVLSAGSHTRSVTCSPTDSTDYTTATASVTILVLNTIVGTNIGVTPVDTTTGSTPVTLTYSNVTKAGMTSLTTSSTGTPAPPGFQPGMPLTYYDISTTATFTGTATICIHYSGITFIQQPHLFHFENGLWVDRTTSIDPVNMIVCGTVTSFSPFALFAPLPVLTITAPSVPRRYGLADPPLNNVTYSGFVSGDTPSVLSGALSCLSSATPVSLVGTYAITCSGLTSPNYTIKFAPGVLTITPAPLTVTAANAQRVYGAPNPAFTGTITGIQNGDNITARYSTTATPTSPVGVYTIVPTLSDPGAKLGNYAATSVNGTLTVVQAFTTTALSATPNPSNFGQSITLSATVAPVAPGAGTATGKVTFFDGSTTLGTATLSSTDTATLTTSSLAAGSHNLTASYGGDPNFSGSSSIAVSDQVQCGVLISLSPSTVPLGGTITVTGKVISCSTRTETVVIQFTLSGPAQPNSCSSTESVMFTTPPFPLPPKTAQTVSFPFRVPSKGVCAGTYSITATTLVNGVAVDTSAASLKITAH